MKVSILLPLYNCEKYIRKSIQSVLEQTFTDFELIIVNDGSTDQSASIVRSFVDPRIRQIDLDKNYGICFALNCGLKHVQGEYIARMDADDIWLPTKLEKQVKYLEMIRSVDVCFTFASLMDEDGYEGDTRYYEQSQLYHSSFLGQKELFERLVFGKNFLVHPSVLIRKSAFEEVGMYYSPVCGKSQDRELWIRFLLNQNAIGMIEEELVYFRWLPHLGWNDRFPSKRTTNQMIQELYYIIRNAFEHMPDTLFIDWYQNEFVNPDAKEGLEFTIEKAFLLLKKESIINLMPCTLYFFEKVLATCQGEQILMNRYNFPTKDFYRLCQNHLYYDNETREEVNRVKQENIDFDETRDSVMDKMTNTWNLIKDRFK
ncbi:MAG: glycosyltransferase family 2 protein [Bacillota bacterium]|nr:glycosyltransferase family 2 protein [Bacillota bacterium]